MTKTFYHCKHLKIIAANTLCSGNPAELEAFVDPFFGSLALKAN